MQSGNCSNVNGDTARFWKLRLEGATGMTRRRRTQEDRPNRKPQTAESHVAKKVHRSDGTFRSESKKTELASRYARDVTKIAILRWTMYQRCASR